MSDTNTNTNSQEFTLPSFIINPVKIGHNDLNPFSHSQPHGGMLMGPEHKTFNGIYLHNKPELDSRSSATFYPFMPILRPNMNPYKPGQGPGRGNLFPGEPNYDLFNPPK
jgi:hypothetical protein